jgi:lambda family phage portal protein
VDRTGREDLPAIQRLAVRTFASQGECFIRIGAKKRRSGVIPLNLEVIDPSRVSTPPGQTQNANVRLGIETDDSGEVVAYHVQKAHPGDTVEFEYTWERVPAKDARGLPLMLHVFEPLFPGQLRGIPWLAAAAQRIKDIDDYWEAELVTKQIEACFSAFIKQPEAGDPLGAAEGASTEEDASGNRLEDIRPGSIYYLNHGEEIQFADPSRPGQSFAPFLEQSLRGIAAALNYPYELLAKNFFRTTFSSGRLAMLDGRVGFRMRQSILITKMLNPIWRWIVFWSVMMELIPGLRRSRYIAEPDVYERHAWQARETIAFIDPEKEIKAHAQGIEAKIESLTEVLAERGIDLDEHIETLKRERIAQAELEAAVQEKRAELDLDEVEESEDNAMSVSSCFIVPKE